MIQLKFLLPILGILVAIAPYLLKGEELVWGVTVLGILIFLASGLPFVTEYFTFGGKSKRPSLSHDKKKSRFLHG